MTFSRIVVLLNKLIVSDIPSPLTIKELPFFCSFCCFLPALFLKPSFVRQNFFFTIAIVVFFFDHDFKEIISPPLLGQLIELLGPFLKRSMP